MTTTTPMTDTASQRLAEAAAKAVYNHYAFGTWLGGEKPEWVAGGNSTAQDLARDFADAALRASQPSGDVAGLKSRLLATKKKRVRFGGYATRDDYHDISVNPDGLEAVVEIEVLEATLTALSAERDAKDARIAELENYFKNIEAVDGKYPAMALQFVKDTAFAALKRETGRE